MKPTILSKDIAQFSTWKLQMRAFLDIELSKNADITVPLQINMIVLSVDVDLLRNVNIDGRTTVNSLFDSLESEWRKLRRPVNPTEDFYNIVCGSDLSSCLRNLQEIGFYLGATDSVIRQRLLEILPFSIRSIAYLEVARNNNLSSAELVSLLEKIPIGESSVSAVKSATNINDFPKKYCVYCKSNDHLRSNCPKLKCFQCGKFGHKKFQCEKSVPKN